LVIGLPWTGALLVWLAGLPGGAARPRLQNGLAVFFSVCAGGASLALVSQASPDYAIRRFAGEGFGLFSFTPDGLGVFLAAVATVVGSLAVIFSIDYMRGEPELGRYYALILFFIGAMAGLALTGSLLLAFVFWEITALCSFTLIAFHNDDPKARAGGLKALIITQLGGIGLLAGALVCYNWFHTFEISALLSGAESLPAGVLAAVAFGFLAAAAAKSAQFPFQTWLPDAMEAPTPVSALIHAATMVNAGVYLLARFYPAFEGVPGWKDAVIVIGVLSALLAAVMAIFATDLKRVLAYSTVSQLGYMVYAVGVGGIFASQFHLLSHAVFKALLFLAAGAVIHSVGTRDMGQMGGLGKKMPAVRLVFVLGALALAGLPILNGFWSKELILEDGLLHGPAWAAAAMYLGAGLTAFYTFRCVWLVFYSKPRTSLHAHKAGPAMQAALWALAGGTLLTWLLAGPFSALLANTLPYHEIEKVTTLGAATKILTAPATLAAMLVIGLGLLAWGYRNKLTFFQPYVTGLGKAAKASFGFEEINRAVLNLAGRTAESLRKTQTGYLNLNIAGILIGLIIVMAVLVWGG